MRNFIFENGQYYHIYNRGVEKRDIFLDFQDFQRFIDGMVSFNNTANKLYRDFVKRKAKTEFKTELSSGYPELSSVLNSNPRELSSVLNQPKLVDIAAYCLIGNHYHLILKQLVGKGISMFMHKLNLGYTNYFNQKYQRTGSLFEGTFKAKHVESEEYLLWLSVYVNFNAQIHGLTKNAKKYKWCSYPEYLSESQNRLCNKNSVINQFKNIDDYNNYTNEILPLIKDKKDFEKYLME